MKNEENIKTEGRKMRDGYETRTIVKTFTEFSALEKKGHKYNVLLDCGHWDKLNKTEMKKKHHICFDCFYGKEIDELAKTELRRSGAVHSNSCRGE